MSVSKCIITSLRSSASFPDVVGYFFLDDSEYEPTAELANFLKAGPPPIYIG